MTRSLLGSLALILASPLAAQWFDHRTPGVPRLKDGKPNLSAPAPRINGKPDLSGVWMLEFPPCAGPCADYVAAPEFVDMGARIGGLPYQPWAAELVKKRTADFAKDDPIGFCRPMGAIRMLTLPPPRKILQLPGLVVILSERDVTFRQLFTDGRPLPKNPDPTFNGYSSGKWEGNTLVVKSIGFRDGMWLDRKGSPMTDAAQVTERYQRLDYGHLQIELTVDDPKAYTKPWTVKLMEILQPDTELLDYHCTDNEKDAGHLIGR